jgi:Zn-finger nucleic acid-binding protein
MAKRDPSRPTWAGLRVYPCPRCQHAYLDEGELRQHMARAHGSGQGAALSEAPEPTEG